MKKKIEEAHKHEWVDTHIAWKLDSEFKMSAYIRQICSDSGCNSTNTLVIENADEV